jgi:cell division protein FtsW
MLTVQDIMAGQRQVRFQQLELALLLPALALCLMGYVMITSASIDMAALNHGDAFYQSKRQLFFILLGGLFLWICLCIPIQQWQRYSPWLLLLAMAFLVAVLIPGLGHKVNGSARWLPMGSFELQPSEFAKLAVVTFIAGYLVRRQTEVRTQISGFLRSLLLLGVFIVLLLLEPDFGVVVVMMTAVLGMFFLSGMRFIHVIVVLVCAVGLACETVRREPYRLQRWLTYLDPWADPFGSGYQLTQAQIAFGRGGWLGEGLGNSMQKLFYLPEAHTDFIFSVLAEELGALGVLVVVALYGIMIARGMLMGQLAERLGRPFAGYLAYGLVLLIAVQAFINIGVNLGLLPTKGLTLPFISYGGNSMLACCCSLGILLRIGLENQQQIVDDAIVDPLESSSLLPPKVFDDG